MVSQVCATLSKKYNFQVCLALISVSIEILTSFPKVEVKRCLKVGVFLATFPLWNLCKHAYYASANFRAAAGQRKLSKYRKHF